MDSVRIITIIRAMVLAMARLRVIAWISFRISAMIRASAQVTFI